MKGFTLVEIMITLLILGVLCGALMVIFSASKSAYDASMASADLQASGRQALEAMNRELRQSDLSTLTITGGNRINLRIPTDIAASPATLSGMISYYVSNNQLLREHPVGITRVIGTNISQIVFSLTNNQLSVTLTASKTVRQRAYTLAVKEQILIRN